MLQYGQPDVLKVEDTEIPVANPGEVVLKVEVIGVNYSDILRRRNKYFMPTPLPYTLGTEAVGEVVAVGEGVTAPYTIGTRVLAILPYGGGYAQYVATIAMYCVVLPPSIDSKSAAAIFVQGSTAQLLISKVAMDVQGKTVLINAAAGGVGSLLVQLAKLHGARVIAACGTNEKLEAAKSFGADVVVNYTLPNWSQQVKEATDNKGVDIVFEMVGGEVYNQSIKSLAQGGQMIVYGAASGEQGTIHPEYFVDENISQSGFNLAFFVMNRTQEWQEALGAVIGMMAEGKLKPRVAHTFDLHDAAEAHRQIEARKTIGKVLLMANA